MSDVPVYHYDWLVDPEAQPLLALAATWPEVTPARVAELRRACSPEQARLVIEQAMLRRRARAKFAKADAMFFTPRALEQATDEIVAQYKVARMPAVGPFVDLCSGIGGDLLALSTRAATVGVDRDPVLALLARANLEALHHYSPSEPVRASRVEVADACGVDLSQASAWHIDPDRRPGGRRTTQVELHEPSAEQIAKLLESNANAAIKLAPAALLPDGWSERAELEWISRAGESRQLVAWFGTLAQSAGMRRATVLGSSAMPLAVVRGRVEPDPPPAARVGRYVYEPDSAVLAAGLGGTLASRLELEPVSPGVAYWTSDKLVDEPAVSAFEVRDILPASIKQLKIALRERDIGALEIKKRSIDLDPEALRRELDLHGNELASLLITRINGRGVAILAQRSR